MAKKVIQLDGGSLTIEDVVAVARGGCKVEIGAGARKAMERSRRVVERALGSADSVKAVYGINTGFGNLAATRIGRDEGRELQRNLVRSHSAGVGEPLQREIVRGMMVALAASLCRGLSGVRVEVVERIVGMLNAGVTPVVPSRGSVGASGDLAPLAHTALVLIGEGEARVGSGDGGGAGSADGKVMSGAAALASAGLKPMALDAKEGLALINGTHLMTAMAAIAVADFEVVFDAAVVAAAMMIDACRATDTFLDERLHRARNQAGQIEVAAKLRALLAGSRIVQSHRENDPRVQDPYSLRCAPQVMGTVLDSLRHVRGTVERELGAVTDNPLVFVQSADGDGVRSQGGNSAVGDIVSGGNFHGMPMAVALDLLAIAATHMAGISERRVFYLLAATDEQNPVNAHLSPKPGLHSGYMVVQYVAAALCNEMQTTMAMPASVANIPTCAGQEDYNSFGVTAAHKARRAVHSALNVVAIELLCAAEGLEYQRPLKSGAGVEKAHAAIRKVVKKLTEDRPPAGDIDKIAAMIRAGALGG